MTVSIPSVSGAAGASLAWALGNAGAGLCPGISQDFQEEILWNLAQGACPLCHGWWVMLRV